MVVIQEEKAKFVVAFLKICLAKLNARKATNFKKKFEILPWFFFARVLASAPKVSLLLLFFCDPKGKQNKVFLLALFEI